jgi:putative peptide zinc metalloprotease protein
VKPGDTVEKDQELVVLSNPALDLEMETLRSEIEQLKVQLVSLQRQQRLNPDAAAEIPVVRSQIVSRQKQLDDKAVELDELILRAPKEGTILATSFRPEKPTNPRELSSWSGSIFDSKNQGMYLDVGQTPVLQIGDPNQFDAILAIDQADIDFVQEGQPVEMKLDALTWKNFEGKIDEKSKRDLEVLPRNMGSQAGGDVAVRTDAAGVQRPLSATYQAIVSFDDPEGVVGVGYRGRARVRAGTQTLGARLWRYLARTFHFYM